MPTPLTRQDLGAISDGVRNRILDRLISRRDVQMAADSARDRILNTINAFHVESQTLIRQSNGNSDQMWRKISALEGQIIAARQDIRTLNQTVNRLYEMQTQNMANILRNSEPAENNGGY